MSLEVRVFQVTVLCIMKCLLTLTSNQGLAVSKAHIRLNINAYGNQPNYEYLNSSERLQHEINNKVGRL